VIAAIDLSLRSAGIVVLKATGEIHQCLVVAVKREEADDEHLLLEIEKQVLGFLQTIPGLTQVVIEGLAFGAKSVRRDLIDGNWWNLKKEIRQWRPQLIIDTVPVTQWRKSVLDKEEQREAKKAHKTDGLKKACVDKLPWAVRHYLEAQLKLFRMPAKAIYDLTDAYWMGCHALEARKG
jgi:hypothetical protein